MELSPKSQLLQKNITEEELKSLQSKTKYSEQELKDLFNSTEFKSKEEGLSETQFGEYLHKVYSLDSVKDSVLIHRLFQLFDRDGNGFIDFDEFASALAVLTNKSAEDKLSFIFRAFDLNGDGKISKEEFSTIVQSLWENPVCAVLFDFAIDERRIEGLEVFVTGFFKEADTNKDGFVSFDEYKAVAKKYTHAVADHKLKILAYQTGGHVGNFAKVDEKRIKKAVSSLECKFYEELSMHYPRFKPFVPEFYGTSQEGGKNWVIMEDLTSTFQKPCVMDIKMGITSAGEDAKPEKKRDMEAKDKESTTCTLGMRITGMKVYKANTNAFKQYTKSWGRKVTDDTIAEALQKYFHNGIKLRGDVVRMFLEQVNHVHKWMQEQSELRLYSSSLLFIYEGEENATARISLKMIDFAHVFPIKDGGKDDGYLYGLSNLVKFLNALQ